LSQTALSSVRLYLGTIGISCHHAHSTSTFLSQTASISKVDAKTACSKSPHSIVLHRSSAFIRQDEHGRSTKRDFLDQVSFLKLRDRRI
jgi:hypothetical protein